MQLKHEILNHRLNGYLQHLLRIALEQLRLLQSPLYLQTEKRYPL